MNLAGGNVPPMADPEDPATAPLVGGAVGNVTFSLSSLSSPSDSLHQDYARTQSPYRAEGGSHFKCKDLTLTKGRV